MFQLRPGETFPITRQLEDPADSTTYYVRAVVRWADSDEIIPINGLNYLNLTDMTDQRFKGNFHVPADGTGLGRPLTITTKVYTDSGYTTLSNTYGIRESVYLVMDRRNPYSGSGGGSGVNYETVRKIIKEELKDRPKLDMGGEAPKIDLEPIMSAITVLQTSIDNIAIPEQKDIDMSPISQAMADLKESILTRINAIRIPEPKETDLSPVIDRIETLNPDVQAQKMDALFDRVKQFLGNDIDEINNKFDQIQEAIENIDIAIVKHNKKDEDD